MAVTVSPERDTVATPVQRALKEAFYAGAISFGLFVLFIGLKTGQNMSNELVVTTRWGLLAAVVIATAVGRFLYVAYGQPFMASQKITNVATGLLPASVASRFFQLPWFIAAVVAAVLLFALNSSLAGWVGAEPAGYLQFLRAVAVIYVLACVIYYFRAFIHANFTKLGITALVLYPILVIAVLSLNAWSIVGGMQGSLKWVDNFGIQILIYVMLAWGLNIVVGLAGLLDLGYVAFYALGAYAYALLATHFGLSFWILLPAAGAMAALWGVLLGFPVLRLRGDYLAIVTLAFGEIIRLVLINWREVTNGSAGISGIPKVSFFGLMSFNVSDPNYIAKVLGIAQSGAYYKIFLYYLILGLCLLTAFVTIRLRRLPVGRAWEALREDEIACRSLGINTTTTKLTAFATGAMFGGFAGSFFAARQGFVSPESFVFLESAIILAIVVLGGMGSLVGIAVAAMVMIGGTEALRELDFLKQIFGPDFTPELYRMLLFGMAMVIVMLWKPRGFVGSREPTAFLKERRAVSGSFTKEGHG
ncbi:MAG: high-affinity branched-chain amino acid ABC transporter permease LivM [Mesorhizobium sp.]|uniref:high-affinity branched-chain amino acid ABC transporter permease LivM n=1 Tax=Mesorhizobium TaxID=68287 RepID=UPI0003CE2B6B|nr:MULTISPECIES: high-affinity branched-chain amino acid ABC transporter permease LivM [Mesorhizobium]ESY67225.1 branched-chain amino acid ABC transporter permease [Mesorhizobium sp. LNHC232B00]ESY80583.1 branched-chain amino acid ABC transporter permease [Mesorhizobium sp. LNHC221B00]TJV42628.1 MAG: high-affinity branched-chain amino acid ABC transporter permease LivM [Mesorhizobium sp.]WJI36998.1 high-affinity branched-chain amino acid ABC transporter permease LivM [Mesorhizobium opportunistu